MFYYFSHLHFTQRFRENKCVIHTYYTYNAISILWVRFSHGQKVKWLRNKVKKEKEKLFEIKWRNLSNSMGVMQISPIINIKKTY